jgi:UDP-N-acetylmuramyl pentapeptide synthase
MPLCKDISIKKINLDIVNLNLAIFRSNEERLKCSAEFIFLEKPLCIVKFSDDMSSMSFDYHFDHWDEGFSERGFSSYLIGLQNIKNIILIARCLDVLQKGNTSDNFIENLRKTLLSAEVKSFSRLKHSIWHSGAHLIDDSYNANPASVKAAIEMLSFA